MFYIVHYFKMNGKLHWWMVEPEEPWFMP